VFLGSKQFFKFSLIHRFCVSVFVIFFIFWGFFEQLFVNVPPCFRYTLIVATFYRFLFLSLSPSLSLSKFFSFSFHFLTFVFFLSMSTYLCCFQFLSLVLSFFLLCLLFVSLSLHWFNFLNPKILFLFIFLCLSVSHSSFVVAFKPWRQRMILYFILFYFLFSFLLLNHNFVKSENDVLTDLFVEWKRTKWDKRKCFIIMRFPLDNDLMKKFIGFFHPNYHCNVSLKLFCEFNAHLFWCYHTILVFDRDEGGKLL
jgi:hypothetical protein